MCNSHKTFKGDHHCFDFFSSDFEVHYVRAKLLLGTICRYWRNITTSQILINYMTTSDYLFSVIIIIPLPALLSVTVWIVRGSLQWDKVEGWQQMPQESTASKQVRVNTPGVWLEKPWGNAARRLNKKQMELDGKAVILFWLMAVQRLLQLSAPNHSSVRIKSPDHLLNDINLFLPECVENEMRGIFSGASPGVALL